MNFISKDFKVQYLPYYRLIIKSGYKNDTILVIDEDDVVQALVHHVAHNPTAETARILALPFQQVTLVLPHQAVTFIPAGEFREEELGTYQQFLVNSNDSPIEVLDLDTFGVKAIFQYDIFLKNRWSIIFPNAALASKLEILFGQSKYLDGAQSLIVHFDGHTVDLLLFSGSDFKFHNSFFVETIDDLSFYILKLMDNFGVKHFDQILLSGIHDGTEFIDRLQTYASVVTLSGTGLEFDEVHDLTELLTK